MGWLEKFMQSAAPWGNVLKEVAGTAGVILGAKVWNDNQINRAILRADQAMTTYADTMADANDESRDLGRASLNMNTHLIASGEHFKEAAAGSGKFGSQLDELADKAARTQEALDAAAQRATAYADAFGAVEGDYTTCLLYTSWNHPPAYFQRDSGGGRQAPPQGGDRD